MDRLFGEIVYGRFERTVTLPEGVNADGIRAVWLNGVLFLPFDAHGATRQLG